MVAQKITVLKVRDVLMVAMPPDPDDATVSNFQDQVMQEIDRHRAKGLVLDISAVDTLDSFFARTIAETAQMVSLMGGETVIAGMHPSVAITTTQLGLTLGRTLTALNVDRAMDLLQDDDHQTNGRVGA
ncbi:MAG TPA: STAS domain-containing protein [Pyrinomonadaceae bacterium]|jgi:rsbT antagonist protein RsbS|nr:STAS domain-containing protein [Pyrinomonadaceae bacterium]